MMKRVIRNQVMQEEPDDTKAFVKRYTLASRYTLQERCLTIFSVDFAKEGLSCLWKPTILQEPTFKEIVMIYRTKNPAPGTYNNLFALSTRSCLNFFTEN